MSEYEVVIGLEVHAQLSTKSKLFSWSANRFGDEPNTHIDAVCLGLPGALPVLNERAVELAVRAALGLDCKVHLESEWARKNYFYPDLPKGYQISQYDRPYATGGSLQIVVDGAQKTVRLTRIHMEEDAGKSVHDDLVAGSRSYVDYNRAGVPLVEIVSEPDLRSAKEAAEYVRTLRQVLRFLGVCDGNMEQGSLRCDANVSIRPQGATKLGTRAEIKNLNSFRFIEQAIDYEVLRQSEVLRGGGEVVQETRLWDTQSSTTRSMRSKEDADDYRYFPDPDLPPLVLEQTQIDAIRDALPELPAAKKQRYLSELGLSDYDADVLTEDVELARFFEAALAEHDNAKSIANWVINDLQREARERSLDSFDPSAIAELVALIDEGTISGKMAKDVFAVFVEEGGRPRAIVEAKGWKQVTDTGAIGALVDEVLSTNEKVAEEYRGGKHGVIGFLVGQVMKASKGQANPKMVNELLRKKLGG